MTQARNLRAVKANEKRAVPKTVSEAAATGTHRDVLVTTRDRIAKTIDDPKCPPRDLASLSRRLIDITGELAALDSREGGDDIGDAAATPDEAFDPEAL